MDEDGIYQRHYEGMYDLLDEYSMQVEKPIVIYAEPDLDSEKVATVDLQMVTFKKEDLVIERDRDMMSSFMFGTALSWVYLETADGTGGWMQFGTFVELADGEWADWGEVFSSVSSGQ